MSSAATLAAALEKQSALDKELSRLYTYASFWPTRTRATPTIRACASRWRSSPRHFSAQSAYIEPEILKADTKTIDRYHRLRAAAKVYRFYLDDVIRRAPHTLTDSEEKLLADAGPLAGSPSTSTTSSPMPTFPIRPSRSATAATVKLDQAAFSGSARAAQPRRSREGDVGVFRRARPFSRTFGTTMNGEVQKVLFYRKGAEVSVVARGVARRSEHPGVGLYALIDGVNRNLPAFHRYLELRKRMMGLDQLHYYDLYAPLVASVDLKYTPEEAQKLVLAAVAPLGTDYQADDSAARSTSAGSICSRTRASGRAPTRTAAPTTSTRTC